MTSRIGTLPPPMPAHVRQAADRLVHDLVTSQARAAEHHDQTAAHTRRIRQYAAAERLASAKAQLKASVTPAKGRSTRRAVKRVLRGRRRQAVRELVLVGSRQAAREARRALAEALAASQMVAYSTRQQGLAHTPMSSDGTEGHRPDIDVASSPRKLRGPSTAGRPCFVVRLREPSL